MTGESSSGTMGAALVNSLHALPPRDKVDRDTQRHVSDLIFEHYADAMGNVLQESMPTVVMLKDKTKRVHEVRVNRLGGGGTSTFSADVQYIVRS